MSDIVKAINEMFEFIKELRVEIQKQDMILEILKENVHLYVNNVNKDVKAIQITITTCDDNFNKVEEWLNEK